MKNQIIGREQERERERETEIAIVRVIKTKIKRDGERVDLTTQREGKS